MVRVDILSWYDTRKLDEEGESTADDGIAHCHVLARSVGLQTWLAGCLGSGLATRRRRLSRVDESVAGDCAWLSVGTRGGDELDAANLSTSRGVGGQEGGTLRIGRGHHFANSGSQVSGRRGDLGATGRVGGCHNDGRSDLGSGDGAALSVSADNSHGNGGGDFAQDFGGLHNGGASSGNGSCNRNKNSTWARAGCCYWNSSSSSGGLLALCSLVSRSSNGALRRCALSRNHDSGRLLRSGGSAI